jgi:serine protease Do
MAENCRRISVRRGRLFVIGLGLWLGMLAIAPREAQAQPALPAALDRTGPISPEKRAELQRTLERHSQVLESQAVVLKTVAKLVGPTVVFIEADVTQQATLHNQARQVEEAGSGVIIQWKGKHYALTNRHVLRGAPPEAIKVNLSDGRRIYPVKAWEDAETDVAVLALDAKELVAAPLGNSDRMEIGDFVLAVGSPFGLSHSVTFGILSGKGRRDLRLGDADIRFQDFLQTDASINPGNSGGPLCNLRGEIIGINTAIASKTGHNEGIGFAIPINMFMAVGRQLIETGKVTRAFLGVTLDNKFGPAMAAELGLPGAMGARVIAVTKASPAEAARLQIGDVILQIDGTRVEDDAHLINLVSLIEVGKKVALVIFRDGKTLNVTVEVGDRSRFNDK